MFVSFAWVIVNCEVVVIPAVVLALRVITFVPVLIELIVVLLGIPVAATTSATSNPVTESTVIVLAPLFTVAITDLTLVTSPTFIIASFTDTFVELTCVVVPSTCKLPLMITSPSLLNPLGNGSMNIWLPPPVSVSILFEWIPILPTVNAAWLGTLIPPMNVDIPVTWKSPPTFKFFSIPTPPSNTTAPVSLFVDWVVPSKLTCNVDKFAPLNFNLSVPSSSYSIVASAVDKPSAPPPNPNLVSSGIWTSPEPFGFITTCASVVWDDIVLPSILKSSTFHWSIFLFWSTITAKPFAAFAEFVTLARVPGACAIKSV